MRTESLSSPVLLRRYLPPGLCPSPIEHPHSPSHSHRRSSNCYSVSMATITTKKERGTRHHLSFSVGVCHRLSWSRCISTISPPSQTRGSLRRTQLARVHPTKFPTRWRREMSPRRCAKSHEMSPRVTRNHHLHLFDESMWRSNSPPSPRPGSHSRSSTRTQLRPAPAR